MIDPTFLTALAILAAVVLLANLAETRPELRRALVGALIGLCALFIMAGTLSQNATPLTVLIALAFGGMALAPLYPPVRLRIARLFPARSTVPTGQDAGQIVGYDPNSPLHMTALVICVLYVGNTLLTVALAGGLTGLAGRFQGDSGASEAVAPVNLLAQMSVLVLFSFLGTGLGTRRTLWVALERLGLRGPTPREMLAAAGMAFALFWLQYFATLAWQLLAPPEVLQEQTQLSGLIAASLNTMFGAFMLAFTAAVGEEIAFRGALQPIFGLWPTSVFFALTHIQYTLTPAALVILLISVGFGIVRQRYNTTAAIIAHFLYNFGLMALTVYGQYFFRMLETMR